MLIIRLLLFYFIIDYVESSMKIGHIGQPCFLEEKKQCLLPHSQCIEGICMCSSFYKYINGSCVTDQSKTLGKHCRGGGDCPGQGEFCSSFSTCMCLSTHVDIGSQCKPVIYPGQFGCEDSLQCNKGFPGAECDVSRICVCPHGMTVNQQTCMDSGINSTKGISSELMLQNVIMADHRQVKQSSLQGNFFRRKSHDNPRRTYLISPDTTCSYDNQCSGYPLAICDSVCKCVKGALNTGTMCIASSTALQSSISCPAGQTYIREAGVCMTVQQPGEPCQYSQQCSSLEPGAYCLKMRCECVYGMKKSSNGCTFVNNDCKERGHIFISETGDCKEVIPPGGRGCSHNLQCSGAYPDATCFMQTCTCPPNLPVAADGTCGRECPSGEVYSGVTGECLPEVQPGQTCLYSSQCQNVFGGLVCDKNTCRCPNGLVYDGMKCSQSCPPHKRVIDKEICVESCPNGLVDVGGRCMKQVAIGETCTSNSQCTSGSFCQSGSCLCPPGFYVHDNQCQAVESDPNGSCQYNEKCTKGSVCYNGKCVCPRNQELVNGHCQPNRAALRAYNTALDNIRRIRLRFSSQAKTNSSSSTFHHPTKDNNSSIVPIGSSCVRVGVTCDGGSSCVAGMCVCLLGMTPKDGVCVKHITAPPGGTCRNGEECLDNSYCNEDRMTCDCVNPMEQVIGSRCVPRLKAHPGYTCTMNEVCVGNSKCVNGKCQCVNGQVEVDKICIDQKQVKLGEACGKQLICPNGSYCNLDTNRCACPKGQREIHGECKEITFAYPGELCNDVTTQCVGGTYCVRGRCECPANMQAIGKKCVPAPKAAPGEPCSEKVPCTGQSICKNSVCTCIDQMIVREKTCVQKRKVSVGGTCDQYDQCLGSSECRDGQCQCVSGYVHSGNICVQRKTVSPGYLCNPEDICTGQSVCIRGMCQCMADYKQMHNICIKKTIGVEGSHCTSRDDCGEGLGCEKGVCSCPEGLFSLNGRCRSYIQLGQTCTTDDRCGTKNAICYENRCNCKQGYVSHNGECVVGSPAEPEAPSQVKSGHICTSDDQCTTRHSHCRKNQCVCKDGFRLFGSTQCIPVVAKPKERKKEPTSKLVELGAKCSKFEICQKGAICTDSICVCPEKFVEDNGVCVKPRPSIRVVVPPLSSCEHGEICSGNSECVHNMCFCKDQYTLFHGKCRSLESLKTLETKKVHTSVATTEAPKTTTPAWLSTTTVPMTSITPILISMKLGGPNPNPSPVTPNPSSAWFKIARPGHACGPSSFCSHCSVCANGFCVCPEGLELRDEKCVSHIDAQRCVASNQCPSGATCMHGECKCRTGLAMGRSGFCVPVHYAAPGTSCSNEEKCKTDSTCIDGICVCNSPLVLKENKCVRSIREKRFVSEPHRKMLRFTPKKKAKLGEYCFRDDHCESQKQCLKNICKCQRNYVQSSFSCVPRMSVISNLALPGESCRTGFCVGGAKCSNFVCKCPDDYFKQGDSCVRYEARIGAPCGMTTGCSSGSQCVSSYCQCQDQYDADADECYPLETPLRKNVKSISTRKVGRVVSANAVNCPIGYDLVNGMCVNSETLSVIQLAEPGGACEDGRVLCTGNSVCANNVCICPGGETVQNSTCISVSTFAAPGDSCDLLVTTCTGNSQCLDGVCKCLNNQGAINGRCTNMGNGNSCGQRQCGMNQICIQNMCQCRQGYLQQPESCLGDRCNCILDSSTDFCTQKQCGINQICLDSLCQCKPGYYQQPGTCTDDRCNCLLQQIDNGGCSRSCGMNQVCVNDMCQCQTGYAQQPGSCMGDRCNCLPQQLPTDGCSQRQCGTNQICIQDQCQCRNGFTQLAETCMGDRCNCVLRSASFPTGCVGTGCSPATSFSPFFGAPTQMCDLRPDAITCRNGAICLNNYCGCPSDKVLSGTECVKYYGDALPGQSCSMVGVICKGGSSCNQNMCRCSNGYQPSGNQCVPTIELRFTIVPFVPTTPPIFIFDLNPLQTCNSNCATQPCLQRCVGGSTCINSICTCPQGSFPINNICSPNFPVNDNANFTRTARTGDLCGPDIVCLGGSTCVLSTCQCDPGYTPSADKSQCVAVDISRVRARSYVKSQSACRYDTDCKDGAICDNKRCACRLGEENVNGKCILANQPGSRCHTATCAKGADCWNGYCICSKTKYSNSTLFCIPNPGLASNLAYPGSKCDNQTTCQLATSCLNGFCVVPKDSVDLELEQTLHLSTPEKNQSPRRTYPPASLVACPTDGSCQLPNCFCSPTGKTPPNNMDVKKVPQMVMLTFDDPITDRIINTLKTLFSGKIRNPNGCVIKGTFFISHQWNNYDQSQWLYSKGNELAVNSITREDLSARTMERWVREQNGMRETLAEFSYAEKSQIIGTRAPMFKTGGDLQFEMMMENNFTFDNSMQVDGLYWPQTLDHKLAWECDGNCPQRSHKGVWEIPIQNVQANDAMWYNTLSQALRPSDSRVSVKQLLMRNFLNNYKTSRAPFVLTLDTNFLTFLPDNGAIHALEDFLKEIVQKPDVYVVTGGQVIDWMKTPTEVDNLKNLRSWQCNFLLNDQVQPCESPSVCTFNSRSRGQLAHSFRICGSCPAKYPWI